MGAMTERAPRSKPADQGVPALWRLAEQLVAGQDARVAAQTPPPQPEVDPAAWHQLRVQSIEQAMQNEELRNAQCELEAARDRYFELYDLAPVGYCTLDATGLIVQANLAVAAMLGCARSAVLHQPISRFIARSDQDAFYLYRRQALAGAQLAPCELRLLKQDHALVWVQLTASAATEANGAANLRLALSDISALKQAQARRTESEARYQAMIEASLDAILLTTPDGGIVAANPAACRMFGRSEEELQHIGRAGVVDSADPRLELALEQRRRTGHFVGELTLLRQNGERFVGEVSVSVFEGANGQPQSSMIIRDATERLRTQAALRNHARQLQVLSARVLAAQEAERRRVAIELHDELGQTLTAIKINLQMLERREPGATLVAENLRIADDALQQVRRIAMALRPALLDDLGLAPALRWLGQQAAQRGGFAFDFNWALVPERLAGELETACFRIVQEALTNIARHAQAKRVQVDVHHDGADHLLLCVQDNGVGFDPIAQRTRTHAQAHVGDGDGMGLLGMQERAALIGGELQIESAPGQGCLLRLRCPLRRPEVAP